MREKICLKKVTYLITYLLTYLLSQLVSQNSVCTFTCGGFYKFLEDQIIYAYRRTVLHANFVFLTFWTISTQLFIVWL